MHKLTGAHRTIPYGTKVLVRNIENNKEVVVKIIDRGPFVDGRIIDLSYAGAKELDFLKKGFAKVKIKIFKKGNNDNFSFDDNEPDEVIYENVPETTESLKADGPSGYTIQVGAFKFEQNAVSLKEKIATEYSEKVFITKQSSFYMVWIGDFKKLYTAKKFKNLLQNDGFQEAFVYKSENVM
jgi:rare lipoprotein A